MTLNGAGDGIEFYVKPQPGKIWEIEVWVAAANQIFYSLGPTLGGLVTLASYNRFDNNCHRDAILVSFVNCCTSVFAGFVVFGILGFMAKEAGKEVKDVVSSGAGLAFVAYPEAVAKMGDTPVPQIMGFLFFLMLLTLGLDSMFTLVETLTTCIMDHFRALAPYKHFVVIGTCIISFVFGLSMCTNGGIFMFDLIDGTCATWSVLLFANIELVLISWVYGVNKFLENIKEMGMNLPKPVKMYWRVCWCFITPVILSVLLIFKLIEYKPLQTEKYRWNGTAMVDYVWPNGSNPGEPNIQALAWMVPLSSTLLIPVIGIYQFWKRANKGKKLGWAMVQPTRNWKPAIKTGGSMDNIIDEGDNATRGGGSKRGSRTSFRKHLPSNASEILG